ncbi:YegJ family protein [Chryseobacterium caseinilyticum]|uniref:DUF2314 domain-containing protein n=1 Tax=Chryseobacterium caseinilyticum TaxID=2771428 RepID=A0ABR8ZDW8_9FLAO|nr:DUF2314 domain-containing protein [Chryseobacterium caseinilyticum]MBD8083463.1 DUF2314 domain-containing protein [Chryseobacterium caseinilyticum]
MKNIYIIAVIAFITVGCQEKKERIEREGEPPVVLVKSEDDEMNSAIENAKKTFEKEFHTALLSKNPNYSNFTIKQRFDLPDNNGEHIWIGDITFKNGKYKGVIQNEPYEQIGVKLGDTVDVDIYNLSDWMYHNKNIVKGGYTVKVLRKSLTHEEKKQMDVGGLIYE